MEKEDNFLFASITKLHGYKGSLLVKVIQPIPENKINKLESVFLSIKGQLIPFFIESLSFKNSEWLYVKFVGIDTEKKATELLKAEIWLPANLIPKSKGKEINKNEMLEYTVIDSTHGILGLVNRVIEMPHYPLLEIIFKNKEVLIPAADEIISKIDRKKKIIYINAPEGLIEMYLQ